MAIIQAPGPSIFTYASRRGHLRAVGAITWHKQAVMTNPVQMPSVIIPTETIGNRDFGTIQGLVIDNTKCRNPIQVIAQDTGWGAVCGPFQIVTVQPQGGGGGLRFQAPVGTFTNDVTSYTFTNYLIDPTNSPYAEYGTGTWGTNLTVIGKAPVVGFQNFATLGAGIQLGLFNNDVLINRADITVSGIICTVAGQLAVAIADGDNNTRWQTMLDLVVGQAIPFAEIFSLETIDTLACVDGATIDIGWNGAQGTATGVLSWYFTGV